MRGLRAPALAFAAMLGHLAASRDEGSVQMGIRILRSERMVLEWARRAGVPEGSGGVHAV